MTMDVNQTPTLEADILFQMIQQYFDGTLKKPLCKFSVEAVQYGNDDGYDAHSLRA